MADKVMICPICGGIFDGATIYYTRYFSQYNTAKCDVCGFEAIPLVTPQEVR